MESLVGVSTDQLQVILGALQRAYHQIDSIEILNPLYNQLWSAAASVEAELVLRAEMGL